MIEAIRANAGIVVRELNTLTDFPFGYDARSVAWLDGFIERNRATWQDDDNRVVSTLGSFLGECIIACYGGAWEESENGWSVAVGEDNAAFPFNKVAKQIRNGNEDSIKSFFEIIPVMLGDALADKQPDNDDRQKTD